MNKNAFIRLYLWLSIAYVFALMYLQGQFLKSLNYIPSGNYGPITSTIFKYQFGFIPSTIVVINIPLIMFFAFVLLTGFVAYLSLKEEPIENKLLKEVVVYNVIIATLLVVSSIVFMLLIPDLVNGVIDNGFIMTRFEVQRGDFQNAFDFTRLFMLVYVVLNTVALYLTREKKFKEKKENVELDSEFLL